MGKKASTMFIILCVFDLTHTKVNHPDVGREKAHLLTDKSNRGKLLFALMQFNKPEGKRWKTVLLLHHFTTDEN